MSIHKTLIDWARNPDGTQGYTWNPITGCLNHVKGMCKGGGFPCYAYRLANGRLKERYISNKWHLAPMKENPIPNMNRPSGYMDPFYPRFWPEKLYHPWGGKPKGIFTCDMSDLFGIGIPEGWTEKVLNLCRLHDENRYYLLTKQPQNLAKFSPFPDNCWVGVTATNSAMMYWAVSHLQKIKAKVKYISFEPLLDWKSPKIWLTNPLNKYLVWGGINWLILGAQTRPTVYPKIEWVQEIIEGADEAGIPVFLKDNLRDLLGPDTDMDDIFWASEKAKLRQEMPK